MVKRDGDMIGRYYEVYKNGIRKRYGSINIHKMFENIVFYGKPSITITAEDFEIKKEVKVKPEDEEDEIPELIDNNVFDFDELDVD